MKHPSSFLGGFLAGALAMYYLDTQNGRRRRAQARDRMVAAGHDTASAAQAKGKRVIDQVRGVLATGRLDRTTGTEPRSDRQLHERIRSRLGRVVSHPGALHVEVEHGRVRLTGHVFRKEVEPVVAELRAMPGVKDIRNELQAHDTSAGVSELQGREQPLEQSLP